MREWTEAEQRVIDAEERYIRGAMAVLHERHGEFPYELVIELGIEAPCDAWVEEGFRRYREGDGGVSATSRRWVSRWPSHWLVNLRSEGQRA